MRNGCDFPSIFCFLFNLNSFLFLLCKTIPEILDWLYILFIRLIIFAHFQFYKPVVVIFVYISQKLDGVQVLCWSTFGKKYSVFVIGFPVSFFYFTTHHNFIILQLRDCFRSAFSQYTIMSNLGPFRNLT